MNIGIVYYSRSGNTKKVAELLRDKIKSKKINAELLEIKHTKKPGFFKAARAAMKQTEMPISNSYFDLSKYDTIIVGSPTWASKASPYVKSFFNKAEKYKGKKAGIFFTSSGETEKAKTGDQLKEYLDSIGLETSDNIIGLQMKKEEIKEGKENIEDFIKSMLQK